MKIKGREYLEEDLGAGVVRLRMRPDGYHVDVDRTRIERWLRGSGYVQNELPELDADQREFLMSGADPAEFASLFGEEGT